MTASTITLLLYLLLLAPGMIAGYIFARRKMFQPHHKYLMTTITLVNWVLIAIIMVVSYSRYVAPFLPDYLSDVRGLLATIHLVTGGLAQLLATYLVILMWTERTRFERLLPYRIQRIKTPMRLTLALWLTTVVLGLGIYLTWYIATPAPDDSLPPAATEAAAPDPAATEAAAPDPAATEAAAPDPAATEAAAPDPAATEAAGG
jgi:uncharacterized membrane protein YozB (DUF420 family)